MYKLIGVYALFLINCFACGSRNLPVAPNKAVPPERTLWQICVAEDGTVSVPPDEYPNKPECDNPTYWKWEQLPVRVVLDEGDPAEGDYHPSKDDLEEGKYSLQAAVATVNYTFGVEMMKIVSYAAIEDEKDFDIIVQVGEEDYWAAGRAHIVYVDKHPKAMVRIYKGYVSSELVMLHEIYHVWGLAHDSNLKQSIMYPQAKAMIGYLTDADKKAIKWLYGLK